MLKAMGSSASDILGDKGSIGNEAAEALVIGKTSVNLLIKTLKGARYKA